MGAAAGDPCGSVTAHEGDSSLLPDGLPVNSGDIEDKYRFGKDKDNGVSGDELHPRHALLILHFSTCDTRP